MVEVFTSYLYVTGWWSKNICLTIFIRCSFCKVLNLSEIVLIKPFTMDLYSLINFMPMSNCFTKECDCFQSHSDFFFILDTYYETTKIKLPNANRRPNYKHVLMKQTFSHNFSSTPYKEFLLYAYRYALLICIYPTETQFLASIANIICKDS